MNLYATAAKIRLEHPFFYHSVLGEAMHDYTIMVIETNKVAARERRRFEPPAVSKRHFVVEHIVSKFEESGLTLTLEEPVAYSQ